MPQYRSHNIPPLDGVLSQLDPLQTFLLYSFRINPRIGTFSGLIRSSFLSSIVAVRQS
jgi:hypothetical protein